MTTPSGNMQLMGERLCERRKENERLLSYMRKIVAEAESKDRSWKIIRQHAYNALRWSE